ncbi:Huntingtin-interacting protein M [Sciurus carolinensis]|uniref:Huntingtin-interacting protein M n=1 Tax=Sciurus carolinensis TaxID=30640 RepID=A0AA41MFB1_SCICA|nr:huntingtin-interacting protein M-like [Sciurus carolinensis]MBZ3870717.1 Huntingtin-interacting protein M [Sciurus carolinensis]
MSGKESSHRQSRHIEDLASRPEIRLPVSYVYHILQEERYSPFIGSSTTHFLLNVLDYLTDYILELVDSKASNSRMHANLQHGKKEGDQNRDPLHVFKNVSSLLEMPGPKRNNG